MLDFHIIITTRNRSEHCLRLIDSIKNQLKEKKYSIHIFDDHSDSVLNIPYDYRIKYFRLDKNMGKRKYWWLADYAFKQIPQSKYYVMLPDDVRLSDNFFDNAVSQWKSISNTNKISLELMMNEEREGRPCWSPYNPKKELHGEYEIWHSQWTDLCFISENKFFEVLNKTIYPISRERWNNNPLLSSGVGQQITERLNGLKCNMYAVTSSLCTHLSIPSVMNSLSRKTTPMNSVVKGGADDKVSMCIASIPNRKNMLVETINSVINQVDKLYLYLNNYKKDAAEELRNINPDKISYIIGDNSFGDAGKFYWADELSGFIMTADDDIIFPSDYVKVLKAGIEKYKRKYVITFHGRIFSEIPIKAYYKAHKVLRCLDKVDSDTIVHIAGTGVMGWHSSTIDVSINDFPSPNMSDVHFSILANNKKVPIMLLAHAAGWIDSPAVMGSIFERMVNKDKEHVRRINATKWNSTLKPPIESAYIINLPHRKDRLNNVLSQCEKSGIRPLRIEASYGRNIFPKEPLNKQGFLGCYESHLKTLKILKEKDEKYFMIIEDDCEFAPDFQNKLEKCIGQLPERWDLLYLGGSLVRPSAMEGYSDGLKRAKDVLCTHAYIVNKKSINGLIEHVEKIRHKIDVLYCEYQKTHECFIVYPELAWQSGGYSDVVMQATSNSHLRYGKNK